MNVLITKTSLTILFSFCLFCTSLSQVKHAYVLQDSLSMEGNQGWEIAKTDKADQPSWIIYSRKIAGTNFLEYKIEGEIQSSPAACVASFKRDLHRHAKGSQSKKYPTYEIVAESPRHLQTYVIHNEPFPLKDTEMSVSYTFFEAAGNVGVRWQEAWDVSSVQPSKKLNRVETFRGSLQFSPLSSHSCQAVQSVQFDPKKMPMFLVEPMVFKFLRNGLEDLRERSRIKE